MSQFSQSGKEGFLRCRGGSVCSFDRSDAAYHSRRAICSTQSTDSNVNLIQKCCTNTPECSASPNAWAPHGPVKSRHEINYHNLYEQGLKNQRRERERTRVRFLNGQLITRCVKRYSRLGEIYEEATVT